MQAGSKPDNTCCLERFNCCVIPFVATFICIGLFTLIIVASKMEDSAKNVSWKETSLIGNAFRIDSKKLAIPILRRCDGPELLIQYFSYDDSEITSIIEIPSPCGSSLTNWLKSSPSELSIHYLNTPSNDIHARVMTQDFIHFSVIDSQNSNASEDSSRHQFSVCILPNNKNNDEIKVSPKNIPEVAAFFESWIFNGASQFIIYDLETYQNNSKIIDLYNASSIAIPFNADKKIIEEKFENANLFFIYDCFYRTRFSSQWIVITDFENIPMIQTRSSLANILSIVSISKETENLVYQITNAKTDEPNTMILDGNLIDGFNEHFQPIFKDASGQITSIPNELVKTYNILQLNAELFQQSNTSAMNQIFTKWIEKYNQKISF